MTTLDSLIEALNRLGYGVYVDGHASYHTRGDHLVSRTLGRISESEARKIVASHGYGIGGAL